MVLGDDVIRLGAPQFATVGEQLRRRQDLPLPVRIISSPFLTGGLLGGLGLLLGGGFLPALGIVGGIPTLAGAVKSSPKLEGLIQEKILRPEEFGERIGGFVEDPISPFKKAGEKVRDVITSPAIPIIAAGVGAAAVVEGVRRLRDLAPTEIERQLQTPTLIPDLPAEPTPIGAAQILVTEKEEQPINIDIDVKPRNEVFINNIIQNI